MAFAVSSTSFSCSDFAGTRRFFPFFFFLFFFLFLFFSFFPSFPLDFVLPPSSTLSLVSSTDDSISSRLAALRESFFEAVWVEEMSVEPQPLPPHHRDLSPKALLRLCCTKEATAATGAERKREPAAQGATRPPPSMQSKWGTM